RQHHGLPRDRMVVRAALATREHALVDVGRELRLAQDHGAPWTTHRLVRGEAHEISMRHRTWMRSARHQPGEMGHVDEEVGVDAAGDRGHPFEIEDTGISAVAAE